MEKVNELINHLGSCIQGAEIKKKEKPNASFKFEICLFEEEAQVLLDELNSLKQKNNGKD